MAISKIILNGVTQMDLTGDSVVANTLLQNETAHGADGEPVVGTYSGGGSSKAVYTYDGYAQRTANSYGATDCKVTVAKAGTYKITYGAWRGSSSGTMGTNVHIGSTAGTNHTTWTGTYGKVVTLANQQIAANTVVQLYATSGSNSRSVYVGPLIVEEV